MPIKSFRNSVVVVLILAGGIFAQQEKPSTVEVSQEFLNSSSRAFGEVVALRTAVAAQQKVIDAQAAETAAKDALIISERAHKESVLRENKLLLEQIEIYRKMNCNVTSFMFGLIKSKRCR